MKLLLFLRLFTALLVVDALPYVNKDLSNIRHDLVEEFSDENADDLGFAVARMQSSDFLPAKFTRGQRKITAKEFEKFAEAYRNVSGTLRKLVNDACANIFASLLSVNALPFFDVRNRSGSFNLEDQSAAGRIMEEIQYPETTPNAFSKDKNSIPQNSQKKLLNIDSHDLQNSRKQLNIDSHDLQNSQKKSLNTDSHDSQNSQIKLNMDSHNSYNNDNPSVAKLNMDHKVQAYMGTGSAKVDMHSNVMISNNDPTQMKMSAQNIPFHNAPDKIQEKTQGNTQEEDMELATHKTPGSGAFKFVSDFKLMSKRPGARNPETHFRGMNSQAGAHLRESKDKGQDIGSKEMNSKFYVGKTEPANLKIVSNVKVSHNSRISGSRKASGTPETSLVGENSGEAQTDSWRKWNTTENLNSWNVKAKFSESLKDKMNIQEPQIQPEILKELPVEEITPPSHVDTESNEDAKVSSEFTIGQIIQSYVNTKLNEDAKLSSESPVEGITQPSHVDTESNEDPKVSSEFTIGEIIQPYVNTESNEDPKTSSEQPVEEVTQPSNVDTESNEDPKTSSESPVEEVTQPSHVNTESNEDSKTSSEFTIEEIIQPQHDPVEPHNSHDASTELKSDTSPKDPIQNLSPVGISEGLPIQGLSPKEELKKPLKELPKNTQTGQDTLHRLYDSIFTESQEETSPKYEPEVTEELCKHVFDAGEDSRRNSLSNMESGGVPLPELCKNVFNGGKDSEWEVVTADSQINVNGKVSKSGHAETPKPRLRKSKAQGVPESGDSKPQKAPVPTIRKKKPIKQASPISNPESLTAEPKIFDDINDKSENPLSSENFGFDDISDTQKANPTKEAESKEQEFLDPSNALFWESIDDPKAESNEKPKKQKESKSEKSRNKNPDSKRKSHVGKSKEPSNSDAKDKQIIENNAPLFEAITKNNDAFFSACSEYFDVLRSLVTDEAKFWPVYEKKKNWLTDQAVLLKAASEELNKKEESKGFLATASSKKAMIDELLTTYSDVLSRWVKAMSKDRTTSSDQTKFNVLAESVYRMMFSMIQLYDNDGDVKTTEEKWHEMRAKYIKCRDSALSDIKKYDDKRKSDVRAKVELMSKTIEMVDIRFGIFD